MLGYLNARQPKGPLRNSQHLPLGTLARSGVEVKSITFFHLVFSLFTTCMFLLKKKNPKPWHKLCYL